MLGKLLTDDQLMYMGCNITYICSLCRSSSKAPKHIFFSCIYARRLWIWFCQNINDNHYPTNLKDLWKIGNGSPKSSLVINFGIVYIINDTWNATSAFRFMNQSYIISSIIAGIKTKMSPPETTLIFVPLLPWMTSLCLKPLIFHFSRLVLPLSKRSFGNLLLKVDSNIIVMVLSQHLLTGVSLELSKLLKKI